MAKRLIPEWADALVVILSSGLVAGKQHNQPQWFWTNGFIQNKPWLPLALTVVAAFFGVFQPFRYLSERRRRPLRSAWERHLMAALGDLLALCQEIVATTPGIIFTPADLGLHVWKVRWSFRPSWIFFGRELVRVKTIRLGSIPALRNVRFFRGKGVVGKCWELNDEVISDNHGKWSSVQTRAEWDALSKEHRQRLSYFEFQRVRDRGAILASPIRRSEGTKFVGCVSVDLRSGVNILEDDRVRNRVQQLCIGLGGSYFEGLE